MRHFISSRAKNRGISVTPPPSNNRISGMLHGKKNYGSLISQLRVFTSNTGSLRSVAQGAWQLESWEIRRCHFLVTLACLAISSKKKCL